MEMLHYFQTMHYLPKVFVVKVAFQRKANNFRNENTQLACVNRLKSTLQWHLEGKTLKINNQNMHFKSVLKEQEPQAYLDRQLTGFLKQLVTKWGFIAPLMPNSFLLSRTTSQLLLYTSHTATLLIFLSRFPLLQSRYSKYLMIFKKCFGSTLGFDLTVSAFENYLSWKTVLFQKRQPLIPCIRINFSASWREWKAPGWPGGGIPVRVWSGRFGCGVSLAVAAPGVESALAPLPLTSLFFCKFISVAH